MKGKVNLAIAEATQVLNSRNLGDGITADKLRRAADKLDKSVASARLGTSHPLVSKASQLGTSLRNKATKQIKVSTEMRVV